VHPVILQDIAAEHVRDMQVTAIAARRARWARRARRELPAAAIRPLPVPRPRTVTYDVSARHA